MISEHLKPRKKYQKGEVREIILFAMKYYMKLALKLILTALVFSLPVLLVYDQIKTNSNDEFYYLGLITLVILCILYPVLCYYLSIKIFGEEIAEFLAALIMYIGFVGAFVLMIIYSEDPLIKIICTTVLVIFFIALLKVYSRRIFSGIRNLFQWK